MKVVRKKKSTPLGTRMAVASPTGESFALLFLGGALVATRGGRAGPSPNKGCLPHSCLRNQGRRARNENKVALGPVWDPWRARLKYGEA